MLRTSKGFVVLALLAVTMLTAACGRLTEGTNLEQQFGAVYQRVQVAGGWAMLSPAKDGGIRELGFVSADGTPAGQRYIVTEAAEADMKVEGDRVVVETKKDGAPQYLAYKAAQGGLEPVDYYAVHAPDPMQKTGQFVVVNKHLNALWYFVDGKLIKTYRVATGRQTQGPAATWDDYRTNYFTPEGVFQVTDFKRNPPYTSLKPGESHSWAGGEPGNPIGTRWMGFSVFDGDGAAIWGIHGTAEPEKIGTWASDGCVRMRTEQAEELFESLAGQRVTLQVIGG